MILDPAKDLEEIKVALKIDYDDDDAAVKRSTQAAIEYIKGAIGNDKPLFYTQNDTELLNLAIIMLTSHYYESRNATSESAKNEYQLGFTSIILQLKGKYILFGGA